jgi:hypothetical protein
MVRVLASLAGVVVAGALTLLVGTPAGAQSSSACSQIESTLTSIQKELPQASSSALASKIGGFAAQLETEAASAPASVKTAVGAFVADLKAAASGKVNVAKLTADANAIGSACTASAAATAPTGAPQTGAGSTAGLQDAPLLYGGAALVAAGGVLAGFGVRRRRRARTSY